MSAEAKSSSSGFCTYVPGDVDDYISVSVVSLVWLLRKYQHKTHWSPIASLFFVIGRCFRGIAVRLYSLNIFEYFKGIAARLYSLIYLSSDNPFPWHKASPFQGSSSVRKIGQGTRREDTDARELGCA
ncbi:unnamed protein product [Prunus brigantina]